MNKKISQKMEKAIYDVCGETKKCKGCPLLGADRTCRVFESAPYSWKINYESRSRWKTQKTWREVFWEKQEQERERGLQHDD